MGDRTRVEIMLRERDYQALLDKDFDGKDVKFSEHFGADENESYTYDELTARTLTCYEVNYANWEKLEKYLQKNNIEYNVTWDAGGDYGAGDAYVRKIKGKLRKQEIYENEQELIYFLKKLEKINDLKKLKSTIKKELKGREPFIAKPLKNITNSQKFIKEE